MPSVLAFNPIDLIDLALYGNIIKGTLDFALALALILDLIIL